MCYVLIVGYCAEGKCWLNAACCPLFSSVSTSRQLQPRQQQQQQQRSAAASPSESSRCVVSSAPFTSPPAFRSSFLRLRMTKKGSRCECMCFGLLLYAYTECKVESRGYGGGSGAGGASSPAASPPILRRHMDARFARKLAQEIVYSHCNSWLEASFMWGCTGANK